MAHSSAVPAVVPENTVARIHRATRENRSLWYHLMVLQEPVQARACTPGEVAKGHKRCIDPPPIISLRVIEGPTIEQGNDITSDYNASFFLQANIEDALPPVARKGAQTLTRADPRPLFGARTSGMMYLDHPTKAGYFVFPTLAVDEKGWYRLSFSLFEITKEERDLDMESPYRDFACGANYRMKIETASFNVYTPKSFPGLMESTELTRTISDQGGRLRIRRHARSKKPGGKKAGCTRYNISNIPTNPQYTTSLSIQLGHALLTEPRMQPLGVSSEATGFVEPTAPSRATSGHIPLPTPVSLDRLINSRGLPSGPLCSDDYIRINAHLSPLSAPAKVRALASRAPLKIPSLLSPALPEGTSGNPSPVPRLAPTYD